MYLVDKGGLITLLAVDLEKEITISKEDGTQVEEWLELGNGCMSENLFSKQR